MKNLEKENRKLKEDNNRGEQKWSTGKHRKIEDIVVTPDVEYYMKRTVEEGKKEKNRDMLRERSVDSLRKGRIDEKIVMRPPLRGVSKPIPEYKTIEREDLEEDINRQIKALVTSRKIIRENKKATEKEQGVHNGPMAKTGRR